MIGRLVRAGVDVFRLNFSHGDRETHGRYMEFIRAAAAEADEPVAIMQDLRGPRIRTGALRGGQAVELHEGGEVVLRPGHFEGDGSTLSVTYQQLPKDVSPGDGVMLADGAIELEVTATDGEQVRCRVKVGGLLGEHKGINLPGVRLSISSPTPKDIEDMRFGLERGVDFVAMSFVRSADDLLRLKEAMGREGGAQVPVIAKIEKPEAVQNLEEIIQVAEGVMVARGDLGIEMRTEAVPGAQKDIISAANKFGVPAICATQMLESMVNAPRPTRAEASDVANAILDGADAVMLSAETSIGRYPIEAVGVMDRIAQETQALRRRKGWLAPPQVEIFSNRHEHALATAACSIAHEVDAAGIVPFTLTGSTARYISQRRPDAPIYALTPDERTYRRLALLWGVRPIMLDVFESTDEMIQQGQKRLLELGLVRKGETVVYVAGASTRTPGGTDMLKIHRFE
jgi:pyruvate kinase